MCVWPRIFVVYILLIQISYYFQQLSNPFLYSFVSPFADKLIFMSGVFSYLSYRDPNLLKTLEVYDGTEDFLRELEMDDNTLTKAIIGTIGDVDSYQLPDAKGYSRYETSS